MPLGRTRSSVGSRFIQDSEASDSLDIHTGRGYIENRFGWQNVAPKQSGFATCYLLDYFRGINASFATVKEYVTIEDVSGTVKPWARNVTTGAVTEITKAGPVSFSLNASEWRSTQWEGKAYFWNPSDATQPLWAYTLGDYDSAERLSNLDPPTAPIVFEGIKDTVAHTTANYREVTYTGVHITNDIAYTGSASSGVVNSDGTLTITCSTAGSNPADFTVTLNGATGPGLQDLTYNDVIYFSVANLDVNPARFSWDPASLKFSCINNDGTPVTAELVKIHNSSHGGLGGGVSEFLFKFPKGYLRSLKDNVRKFKFAYRVTATGQTGTGTQNKLKFSKVQIGGVSLEHWGFRDIPGGEIKFNYYWKDSATGDVSPASPNTLTLTANDFIGEYKVIEGVYNPMGVAPRFTATNGSQSDKWVLVAAWENDDSGGPLNVFGEERIVAEYADSALSQYYIDDLIVHKTRSLLSDLDRNLGLKETDVLCAVAHRGHMVWGVKGGKANIQHSAVGNPLYVFREDMVDFDNVIRPANFTMSDDYSENPVRMHSVGDSLIILGENGVYAQSGDLPISMTFIKRVGSLPGSAGYNASTVFMDQNGQEGVAYMASDLETLYYVPAAPIASGVYAYPPIVINEDRRPEFKSHLFGGTAPTASDIHVRYDPVGNSLWVVYHDKAFEFRYVDGDRYWERYDYSAMNGNWVQFSFSEDYAIRAMRSTGEFDEIAYDNSNNKAGITGANRDNGEPVTGYWDSKTFIGENTRIGYVHVDRDGLDDAPTLTVASTRKADSKTIVAGSKKVRFGADQQGTEHRIKVTLTDDSQPVHAILLELSPAGRRTNL